ncbi:hypothetical protein [Methylomonas sp. MK1]|uniref:hypothetical protein n=1 Tax=Methylomonas sp. MK1 TaxID=1131552 RepID=UPI001267C10C|nr:hypothetical protein [Methylomonas sp. MK1]
MADRRLKFLDESRMLQIKADADAAREQRILEAKNLYSIQAEQRGLENDKIRAQNAIDINTNPDNVARAANAEIAKLKTKDEYGDSRFDTELDQATRKANALDEATYHDNTDYEGRRLSHELDRLKLDEAKQPQFKMTKADEKRYDFLKSQYESLAKARSETTDEKIRVELLDKMDGVSGQVDSLLSRYDGEGKEQTKAAVDDDPLGVKRDLLLKDLRKINPKVDVSEKLSNSDLQEILDYERKNQGSSQAEKPKGMLGATKLPTQYSEPKPKGILNQGKAASSEGNSLKAMVESENDPDKLLDLIVPYLQPSDIDGLKSMPANQRGDRIRAIRDRLIRLGDI